MLLIVVFLNHISRCFLQDGSFSVKHFEEINTFSGQKFDFKTMISSPNLKRGLDISNYSFNQYTTKMDENSNYTISEYYQGGACN